jgi:hypothetical protein
MAKVKLRVTDNTSLNVEGTIYRAGDVFGLERDDTAKQLLSAGLCHRGEGSEEEFRAQDLWEANVPE